MSDLLVLGYHAVSEEWTADLAVTPAALERQLSTLVRRGYCGATFHDAVSRRPSGKTVVVTFDDAYRSVRELALPILAELSIPATVFVPTRFAAGDALARWSGVEAHLDGPHERELTVMSWSELASLAAVGWEIGSHARSHPMLTQIADRRLSEELIGSREDCETQLCLPCRSLAYPYGDTNDRVISATERAGYTAAAGLPRARRLHSSSALNWPRIGVFINDGSTRFNLKVSPTGRRLRSFVNGLNGKPIAPRASHAQAHAGAEARGMEHDRES